jgi:hypothetical protein
VGKFEQKQMMSWARNVHEAAGVTPTEAQVLEMARTASSLFVTGQLVPWAEARGIGHFAHTVQPLDAAQMLDRLDDLMVDAQTRYATHRLSQTGEDRSLINKYYNPAYDELCKLLAEWKRSHEAIWANDVRQEAGLSGTVSADTVRKAVAGGGGCVVSSLALVALTALLIAAMAAAIT